MSEFPELTDDGVDDDDVIEHFLGITRLGYRDMGEVLATYRPWPGLRAVRHMGSLSRRPDIANMSSRWRVGVFGFDGLVLNGLDAAIMSPWNSDPDPTESPFAWWLIGTRRAGEFVADLEAAMVADGYPAKGLAAHALAEGCTQPLNDHGPNPIPPRMATDPVIGVHGPRLP